MSKTIAELEADVRKADDAYWKAKDALAEAKRANRWKRIADGWNKFAAAESVLKENKI